MIQLNTEIIRMATFIWSNNVIQLIRLFSRTVQWKLRRKCYSWVFHTIFDLLLNFVSIWIFTIYQKSDWSHISPFSEKSAKSSWKLEILPINAAETHAADVLTNVAVDKAELPGLVEDLEGILHCLIVVSGGRHHFLAGELASQLLQSQRVFSRFLKFFENPSFQNTVGAR